jgi:hypothetical protein
MDKTRFLTDLFNVTVKAKQRSGGIDAFIPLSPSNKADIEQKLTHAAMLHQVQVEDNQEYMVIPEINAEALNAPLERLLKPK